VVGALGRFPRCKGVNGSNENGGFHPLGASENKLRKFRLRHVEVTAVH
jgi:hypothetical protein